MADNFNPHHVWLGIPPEEQPANHYRLLGIRLFENNSDVIDGAADRQMAHLRTFQSGKHGEQSQKLLNDVAAARVCLLDAKKRAVYDTQLRAKLPSSAAPGQAAEPSVPAAHSAVQPTKPPPPLRRVASAPAVDDKWDDLLGSGVAQPSQSSIGKSPKSAKLVAAKQEAKKRQLSVYITAAVLIVAAALGIGMFSLTRNTDGAIVFDLPEADRVNLAITVDDAPIAVVPNGSWEQTFPRGNHHVVAQRPGFKFDTDVALAAGQKLSIAPEWKTKAVLVISWPLADRAGAVFKVDGHQQPVSQREPLELPVDPGLHRIEIARPELPPFFASATVAEDQRKFVLVTQPLKDARLLLEWPAAHRAGCDLSVDGQTIAGSSTEPWELTLKPGQHVIFISRPGFEAFSRSIDLAAGSDISLRPTWKPKQKAAPVTVVQGPVETEAPKIEKKLPIPAAADQERIAKQLDELYKTSRPGSKTPAKAQELYDVAAKAGASPVERYMLLTKGAEIAASGGDLNLALQGVDTLAADFEIPTLEIKVKLLEKFVNLGKADQVEVAIGTAEPLMDQSIAADRYDLALVLATAANHAAVKAQIPARKETDARLARRRRDIHLLEPLFAAAKKAQDSLVKNPADPEANLTLGRWRCIYKSNWTEGLPLLVKGSDEKLKTLAEQNIKFPSNPEEQVALADGWWDVAQKEAGVARDSLHLHAGELYESALPNLTSALKKAAIEKRLAEIADLPRAPVATAQQRPSVPKVSSATSQFPLGQWVDILRLVDTARDQVSGKWTMTGTDLSCEKGQANRLEFPVVVDGGYDLEVDFTRVGGSGDIATMLSIGSHSCMAGVSAYSGGASGLMNIDGREANNPDNPISIRPGMIENDHRHRLVIRVRVLAEDQANFDLSLDGMPYLPHWEGNPASLSEHWFWEMPNRKRLGLGTSDSEVVFHSVRLKMVSGHALSAAAAAELLPPELTLPTASADKPSAPVTFPHDTWVDVLRLVDTVRDRVNGAWSWNGNELSCKSAPFSRVGFPFDIDGGYDFEVDFTRTAGNGDIAVVLPVGSHGCVLTLSSWGGQVSGISNVDGHWINDPANPITVRPGTLENDHRYRLSIGVRILSEDRARIDVSLDGKPYLPRWEGDPVALSVMGSWALAKQSQIGIATYTCKATFHSARLRMASGHASSLAAESIAPTPVAPTPIVPAPAISVGSVSIPTKFPRGQWVDILSAVSTETNVIRGTWSRNGSSIACEPGYASRIEIPIVVEGSYELEVEFTRTSGDSDVNTIFVAGSRQCMVKLCGAAGDSSGLEALDGRNAREPGNPASNRTGPLQTGHRYRLLIKVQAPQPDRASIDIALDGKRFLPRWEGNPDSLGLFEQWRLPNFRELGLAAHNDGVTFHSVRLRLGKGEAAPASAVPAILRTDRVGGNGGGPFTDIGPTGSMLVGFHVVSGGGVIHVVQPKFRSPRGTVDGPSFGDEGDKAGEAIAKPGYAVGAIVAKGGDSVDGFRVVFMRIVGNRLDPKDSYESEWLGGRGGGGETTLAGDGSPVVGIFGGSGKRVDSLGLIVEKSP